MFSLRDSTNSSSLGTEESFGWWIGVELHAKITKEAELKANSIIKPPESLPSGSCACSDDLSCDDISINEEDDDDLNLVKEFRSSFHGDDEPGERIELCSFSDQPDPDNKRTARCYTPERLIKSEDYRILVPSPRFCRPSLADLSSLDGPVSERFTADFDDGKIEAVHLASLLQNLYRNASPLNKDDQRCCCIRYGNGEVFLHTECCPKNYRDNEPTNLFIPMEKSLQHNSEYGSCCDESSRNECSCNPKLEIEKQHRDVVDDSSGISSVDPTTGITQDWSCATEEDDDYVQMSSKIPNRLSDELAYASFEYALTEHGKQGDRRISQPEVNEVVSILADLESDPSRVKALLLDEDRFCSAAKSEHDCLARLALAIEPDDRRNVKTTSTKIAVNRNRKIVGDENLETELDLLRDRIERLQGDSKNLYEEITSLRRDFAKDEWKVDNLSEDMSKLRNEVCELRYLDDLLKLLKGELERISNKNWPFLIGNIKHRPEEINLVV